MALLLVTPTLDRASVRLGWWGFVQKKRKHHDIYSYYTYISEEVVFLIDTASPIESWKIVLSTPLLIEAAVQSEYSVRTHDPIRSWSRRTPKNVPWMSHHDRIEVTPPLLRHFIHSSWPQLLNKLHHSVDRQ